MAKPTRDDFIAAARARYLPQQPDDNGGDEQGIIGDAVDMFQRGLGQTLGGDLETVGQLTDSQGIKDAGRGVSAWADGQLEQASTPMREAMGKQFFQENAETGAIEAGDAWADPRAWAGNFSTVLGQFVGLVGGTKGAGLIAKPAMRGAGKLLAKDLVEGQAKELVAKATVKDAISAGALDSVRAAYLAAPGEAAKRAVLDKAIGRLTSIGYGAHAGAMASGMRAQQAEQEARGYFNGLGNDELNANPIYQQAYWDLADGEMQGADIGDIRRAAIDSVAERAATDAWSDPRALAADFASGLLTGAGGGVGGLLGKVGSTRAGAAMRGFAGEGATEAWQGGETQRAVNQAVQEWADESRDPMAGVLSAALNEGTLGGAFGGVVGAVHGPQAPDMAKPVVRIERRVVTGDQQMDDMIHGLDQRQAERGASISSEIDSMFAGASNPLGSGKFDPVRDVPAYQRQGFVRGSHDFQGKPIVPLEGELLDPATALSATPSGPLPDMGGQPSDPALDMAAIADQRISGELQDEAALPGPQANLLPGATYEGEAREVGADLPVPRSPTPAEPEFSSAATAPLPEGVRLTRRGLPFSSEKEAALASRQDEAPIPLDGGGFGIAKITEVEQVRGEQAATVPQGINQEARDNGLSQPLVPAVDTGYREEITATQPQAEASNEQAPQVLAISSERQGDQPGAGQPVAESAGAATAGLSDRAGTGDRADLLASAPVPDGQQQNDQTLTAPATDAGVDVSGPADPAPLPWSESINNADGTITLKGEIPIIRQWAKDNGVKAIPGKGGVVVAKSSAAKVRDMVAPAATEPVLQIEAEVEPANKVRMSQQQEGLSVDEAQRIADNFMQEYNGNIPIQIRVKQNQEELYGPGTSKEEIGYGIEGSYSPERGVLGLVSGVLRSEADARRVLRHEALGHYGLDTFTPKDKSALLQKLINAKNEKWIAPVWKQIAGDSVYGKKSDLHQAEEVFAHIAEKGLPSRTIQAWNDIKTEFARLLRKSGLVKGPIKEHELDSLIKAVGKGIRNGERTKQNIRGDQEVIGKQADEPAKDGKPERIINFSKQAMAQGDKPAKSLTRKEAELVTKEWFKQYRGASGIDVQIHATQAELEQALGLDAKEGLIRRAAFDDDTGTLHVAADTIANPKRMREILRHEVLAHYGLANVLGDGEYTKLISRLIKSKKDPRMKAVWDWVDTHYADEDIGVQAEEVVAHLAELEQGAWGRGWDRVVAWVTKALRAVGFVPDGITAAETRSLIDGLGKKMKRGSPDDSGPDGGKKFSQEEQPAKKGGIKMSQTSTQADDAMKKLNLGPKPDVIDNTKANLDKLRAVDRGVVKSWVDRFIKKANTEVLDALAPIKYAEQAAGITDAADSGYIAARMATGAASTMQATMLYGLPEWKDGVIQRKAGTGENDALLGIFSDLGKDLHNWLGWMAGHRAEILLAQGRENLLDANDIAALKAQGKGKEAKFNDAKARWNRLNAATLDLAQEAGLFTADARAEFENEWYIPFFRESDNGDVIAPFKPKGIANQNAGIKKLKGGEANTNDLLENIFTSTSKLIDASMKNMAAQKTVWNLADTGAIEVVAKPNMMDWRALKNGKDLITVKLEGEDYMIRVVDPDLYRAMTFFDRQPFGDMVNMASKAKRLLTAGVTASPEFMLRNFLRDSLSSWAISKDGFKPVIDSLKGVRKTWRMEGSTIDVMFSGASFLGGYVNGNDPTAMADTVRKSLRRKGMTPEQITQYEKSFIRNAAQAKGVVANVWEKYNRLGEAVENGNREAVYEAAIKAGKSHAQAAFESKDLMDFSMLGAARTIQMASLVLPFFNARIQGLGKLSRELRDNPREIAKRAGMITAMSLGLLAMNWDDERYEELPDWDKDSNWHFFVGDQHFRIPKPFEIGVMFGTIPERMVRALGDKDTGAQFGKAVARAIGDTFALNPTPQIVKPMVEAAFNYDSFRGGPIDGPQDLAVRAEARYNEQTSLLMRELGELSGFSPKQLEHLVIGYTGTIGSYVMAAADGLIRAASPGESASWRADEIPLVKAVYRGTGPAKSTQHMEEFYRMLNEVNQLKRTVDQYRSEGLTDKANELLDEQGGILKSRRSLSRTQQQVRVVRNKIELIQRDKIMTAEEKRRRIDELLSRRNDLVYQAVNRNIQNWE
ncbi:LPD38 domain-containing protein [Aeromonas salmonicida]|uniref:LPD38 domain-containing protein n=1 Tax=Aeromonas salmonicida TaxID=645 RepID=UPI0038BA2C79